jgi:hypothetical protein
MKLLIESGASTLWMTTGDSVDGTQGSLVGQTLIIDALKKTMSEEELKITLTCTPTRVAALSCLPQQVDTCRARRN